MSSIEGTIYRATSFPYEYAFAGSPTEIFLATKSNGATEEVIWWTDQTQLRQVSDGIEVIGDELILEIKGGSSTNTINVAYDIIVEVEPLIPFISK